jgi:oxygen-dependent protoporphyrinogen oxidase
MRVSAAAPRGRVEDGRSADVLVIGAGMSGLGAALALQRSGLSVRVVEQADIPGGRVRTERWRDARLEIGAQFLTRRYRRVMSLASELGLGERLHEATSEAYTAIRRDGRWHYADLSHPASPIVFSGIGLADKWSVMRTTLAGHVRRTRLDLGDLTRAEALDVNDVPSVYRDGVAQYFLCPPFEVLLGYRPHQVSFGLLATVARNGAALLKPEGGMATLPVAAAARCEVDYGVSAERLSGGGDGVRLEATAADGARSYEAKAAVIAVDPAGAARLWSDAPRPVARFLRSVRYSRTDWAYLRLREPFAPTTSRGRPLRMELVPEAERAGRTSLSYLGFMDEAAESGGLMLAAAGPGSAAEALSDDDLVELLVAEAEELHPDLRGQVTGSRIVRWPRYVPLFAPGYSERLRRFRESFPEGPVQVAGDYLRAPWMEGALRSGEHAAERVAVSLGAARAG